MKCNNDLPDKGGGRSAKDKTETVWKADGTIVNEYSEVEINSWEAGSSCFWATLKSVSLKELFWMSQHWALTTGVLDFFSGQQSFTCVKEIFVLPLFRQTILLMVKPRLDSTKTVAKNKAVIFWKIFI